MALAMELAMESQQQHQRYHELFGASPVTGDDLRALSSQVHQLSQSVQGVRNGVVASDFSTAVVPQYAAATAGDHVPLTDTATALSAAGRAADISTAININGANAIAGNARSEAAQISAIPNPDSPEGLAALLAIIDAHQVQSSNVVFDSTAAEVAAGQQAAEVLGEGQPKASRHDPTIQAVDNRTGPLPLDPAPQPPLPTPQPGPFPGTVILPPGPPGKEWHMYPTTGWVLEDALKPCPPGDIFFDLAEGVGLPLLGMFGGLPGIVGGLIAGAHGSYNLNQCAAP